ncbi:MAG TPA: hypothetical protein VFU74_10045 [Actinocrinis sp.]|nr:hypothetical protein [Actinocrinis sp.]
MAGVCDLVTIKDNRPALTAQLRALTVKGLLFPHASQVMRVVRKRRKLGTRQCSTETVYAVADLTAQQATIAEPAGWLRGHWIIENSLRYAPAHVVDGACREGWRNIEPRA